MGKADGEIIRCIKVKDIATDSIIGKVYEADVAPDEKSGRFSAICEYGGGIAKAQGGFKDEESACEWVKSEWRNGRMKFNTYT